MKTLSLPRRAVHNGDLILVDRRFPYVGNREDQALVPIHEKHPKVLLERGAAERLSSLMGGVDGWSYITPVSGWRSLEEQEELYAQSLWENGPVSTERFVARPGHSEHQTGLAIDLGLTQPEIDLIRPEFPYTGICQKFRGRAAAHGFIERYPVGKEGVTGIAHEPWHFRYVGRPHAEIMVDKGWTLEEYHDVLKGFPFGGRPFSWRRGCLEYTISYLEADGHGDTRFVMDDEAFYTLSGDNEAGFIVTVWRERSE